MKHRKPTPFLQRVLGPKGQHRQSEPSVVRRLGLAFILTGRVR